MKINGLPGSVPTLPGLQDAGRSRVEQERAARPQDAPPPPISAPRDPLDVARAQPTLPAEPPAGTDPELWSILSAEERVFFAKVGAMGPLTYGRVSAEARAESALPRGGRLDVRA